ncbi:hypothetical protein F5Y15DRAFT_423026 [Xylariaceae sp. FL0016]|nr:hypothetical protein F5Y15DRAFT_423026 [Xylariaceae sp. FL0016]
MGFCMAVSRSKGALTDPHVADSRWLSEVIADRDRAVDLDLTMREILSQIQTNRRLLTLAARDSVLETLRMVGLHTHVYNDKNLYEHHRVYNEDNEATVLMHYQERTKFNMDNYNQAFLRLPGPVANWDASISEDDNREAATVLLMKRFNDLHEYFGMYQLYTVPSLHENLTARIRDFLHGPWPSHVIELVEEQFVQRMQESINDAQDKMETRRVEEDPLAVWVYGMKRQYFSWTCTAVDTSVCREWESAGFGFDAADELEGDGGGRIRDKAHFTDYLPDSTYRPGHNMDMDPGDGYNWFFGKVCSPTMVAGDEAAFNAIKRACGTLRANFRIHKPTSELGTELNIQIGNTHGWSLLELKKFATLWMLIEDDMELIHTEERRKDARRKLENSILGVWAKSRQLGEPIPEWVDYFIPRGGPNSAMDEQFDIWVPHRRLYPNTWLYEAVHNIWRYISMNGLREGLKPINFRSGDKCQFVINCDGYKRSGDRIYLKQDKQTVEIAVSQGTLDSDYIKSTL